MFNTCCVNVAREASSLVQHALTRAQQAEKTTSVSTEYSTLFRCSSVGMVKASPYKAAQSEARPRDSSPLSGVGGASGAGTGFISVGIRFK